MSENIDLRAYVPTEAVGSVHIDGGLVDVVARLLTVIPPEELFASFSSLPEETGGTAIFPYCRVDGPLVVCFRALETLNDTSSGLLSEAEITERYARASLAALRMSVWIEIGFQGLDNLAVSPASVNWTTAVGHNVNDEKRARRIMTSGREVYAKTMKQFVEYRDRNNIQGDVFSRLGVEYLLDQWRS